MYLCIDSFHHASHKNSEPGWNFCFKIMQYYKQPISIADQIAQLKSRGLIIEDENVASKVLNVPQHEYLDSWIVALAALRNCCAHHARVWNPIYPMKPQLPTIKRMRADWVNVSNVDPSRLYALLCCLLYWVNNIQPDNSLKTDIIELLKKYPNVDPSAMGFPIGWETEPLWK